MASFVNKPKKNDQQFTAELNGQVINFHAQSIDAAKAYAFKYFKPSQRNADKVRTKIYVEPVKL